MVGEADFERSRLGSHAVEDVVIAVDVVSLSIARFGDEVFVGSRRVGVDPFRLSGLRECWRLSVRLRVCS